MEKNRDRLQDDLVLLLQVSSVPFFAKLFQNDMMDTNPVGSSSAETVAARYKEGGEGVQRQRAVRQSANVFSWLI